MAKSTSIIVERFGAGREAALLARSLTRDLGAGLSAALLTAPIARWLRTSDDHGDRAAKSGRSHVGMACVIGDGPLRRQQARSIGSSKKRRPRDAGRTKSRCQRYGRERRLNRNAAIPRIGRRLRDTAPRKTAQQISLNSDDRPIGIADYGSSQGKNSLAPIRSAIATLRMRAGRQRPIFVCHTDLPANDFSEMFALLESDPESYLQGEPQVFPYAIGRSFYRSLFPPGYVDLGWSSYAAVWLSPRFLCRSQTTSSFPARRARFGPSSIARRHETGKHS